MYSSEQLESRSVEELLEIAKSFNLIGRSRMKKAVLIENIVSIEKERGRYKYIQNAKTGTIIAFKVTETKAFSGMVIQLYEDAFDVETKNGRRFNVPHDSVIWVKTNGRWPKAVYDALKGVQSNGDLVIEGSKAANC